MWLHDRWLAVSSTNDADGRSISRTQGASDRLYTPYTVQHAGWLVMQQMCWWWLNLSWTVLSSTSCCPVHQYIICDRTTQ